MRRILFACASVFTSLVAIASSAQAGDYYDGYDNGGYSRPYYSSYSRPYYGGYDQPSYSGYQGGYGSSYRTSDCCYRKVTKFVKVYSDGYYPRSHRSSYYGANYSSYSYPSYSSYSYPSYSYRSSYSYPSYSYGTSYNYGSSYYDGPRYSSYGYRSSYGYPRNSAFHCSRSVRYYDPEYGYRWGTVSRC